MGSDARCFEHVDGSPVVTCSTTGNGPTAYRKIATMNSIFRFVFKQYQNRFHVLISNKICVGEAKSPQI